MFEYLDPPPAADSHCAIGRADGPRQNKGIADADNGTAGGQVARGGGDAFQKLTAAERLALERWSRQRSSPHRLVMRSRIVLLVAEGLSPGAVAAKLHVAPATVRLWAKRFANGRVQALLQEAHGRGRRVGSSAPTIAMVLEATRQLADRPRTVRQVASRAGTSPSTVWRIWRRGGLTSRSSTADVETAIAKVIAETGRPR
jgi:transposase